MQPSAPAFLPASMRACPATVAVTEADIFEPLAVRPLITIITVAYNSAATIAHSLRSIASQSYPYIEHIVIDGGSSDATLSIIRSFPHVARVVSEKDKGIYDAMNKGFALASGCIIGFLNSDDFYADEAVLEKVVQTMVAQQASTLYGDLQYVSSEVPDKVLRHWVSGPYNRKRFLYGWMPPHPSFFARREVFAQAGVFNTRFRSAADYELMLRVLFVHRHSTAYLPHVLVKMRAGGASNGSLRKRLRANREDRQAWRCNGLKPYFFTLYLKPVRKIGQYLNKEQMRRIPLLNAFC